MSSKSRNGSLIVTSQGMVNNILKMTHSSQHFVHHAAYSSFDENRNEKKEKKTKKTKRKGKGNPPSEVRSNCSCRWSLFRLIHSISTASAPARRRASTESKRRVGSRILISKSFAIYQLRG